MSEHPAHLRLASSNPDEAGQSVHTEKRFVRFHTETLEHKNLSKQTVRNHLSAYNGFFFFLDPDQRTMPLGWGFGSDFEANLERYVAHLTGEKLSQQYVTDVRSRLQSWRVSWIAYSRSTGLPEKFSQALKFLVESSGLSLNGVAREVGVSFPTFSTWVSGKRVPRAKSVQYIRRLEKLFELPPDALRGRLPKVLRGGRKENDPGLIPWRERQREIALARLYDPNYVPVALKNFPPEVEAECGRMIRFFTDSNWCSVRGLKRNSTWRVRQKDGRCVTGEIKKGWLADFFGFAVSPLDETELKARAEGDYARRQYAAGELTVALLSDAQLVNAFLQRKKRSRAVKAHNSFTQNFLDFAAQLVRPDTGFLWQQPEYAGKMPGGLSPEGWRAWCAQSHGALTGLNKEFRRGREYRQTRDSWEPIRAYVFNRRHPVDVLDDAVALMKEDFERFEGTDLAKAIFCRNLLLVEFLSVVPLRVWNFSIMEWRADNSGHLYQPDDGQFWIRYDESDFKAEHLKETDQPYNFPLPERVGATIKEYLSVHRPVLIRLAWEACKRFREERGATASKAEERKVINCPYVFRPRPIYVSRLSESERLTHVPVERVAEETLSADVLSITRHYVEQCVGIGTHAFRKLVGSEIAKNYPQHYALGAAVLHNRPATFEKSYQIVEVSDFAATYNENRERRWSQREDERKGLAGRIGERGGEGKK